MRSARASGAAGAAALVAAIAIAPAAAGDFSATLQPAAARRPLAGALVEISGLAPAGGARVYAHTDESATIYELDAGSGAILRTFSLGLPAVIGDFEAIATRGDVLSLVTSGGVVYEATLQPGRRSLAFRAIDTGLRGVCEIEGFAPAGEGYFLACKQKGRRLVVYKWSREKGAALIINMKLAGAVPNPKTFRAADLAADEARDTLLVLDSSRGAILEVTFRGKRAGYWRLGGDHPQAEGLALLNDGRLLVADEGKIGKRSIGAGMLTRYPARR